MASNASIPSLINPSSEAQLDTANALATSLEKMKSLYQADQQAKFLNLQAEADTLFHQLQEMKQQRSHDAPSSAL